MTLTRIDHGMKDELGVRMVGSYRVGEHELVLHCDSPGLARLLDDLLSDFRSSVGGRPVVYEIATDRDGGGAVHIDGECLRSGHRATPQDALYFVIARIWREGIRSLVEPVVIHASAASFNGQGVILAAIPDSGKTTTVAGLVRAGFEYLTDEAALIDRRTGLLHPFPRPLAMTRRTVDLLPGLHAALPNRYHEFMSTRQYHVPAEFLRAGSLGQPCPVRFVVFPGYSEHAVTQLEPVGRAAALTLLAEHCFNLDHHGGAAVTALAGVVRGADCYRLSIGDLDEAVATISDLFDQAGHASSLS